MDICRVSLNFPPEVGGLEYHTYELTKQQAERGNRINLFIFNGGLEVHPNVKLHKFSSKFLSILFLRVRFIFRIIFMALCCLEILKLHAKKKIDIIHLHGDIVEALYGGILGGILRIPTIITIHSGLPESTFFKLLAKICFYKISHIIAVSNAIKEQLINMKINPDKISVISSGINLEQFQSINVREREEIVKEIDLYKFDHVIISVGNLRPMKGFRYLISAIPIVLSKYPTTLFVIIGDGPDKENLLKQSTGIKNIKFTGKINKERIPIYLSIADIFVLPSIPLKRDIEGTPTVIMEAMASWLPVVATRVGGVSELIRDKYNGFLVKPRDSNALAECIIKLIENRSLGPLMGNRNKTVIQDKDWSVISEKVFHVYEYMDVDRTNK